MKAWLENMLEKVKKVKLFEDFVWRMPITAGASECATVWYNIVGTDILTFPKM